jgi:deoxyhypusine synthase
VSGPRLRYNARVSKSSRFLNAPVQPFAIEAGASAEQVLERMERISFQGRTLAAAHRVWQRMLGDRCLIFLGLAGALSAGGLRLAVAHLIHTRAIDCIVSTGANLYHDLHETRGRHHFIGSPAADDAALAAERIDRVYDTFADEDEFADNDEWIARFALDLEPRPCTTRQFLHDLGERLWRDTGGDGILTAAYRAGVPIYCPAIADSSLGMGLAQARHANPAAGHVDVIGDIVESTNLVIQHPRTASIVFGGGTPKNFINQAAVEAEYFSPDVKGHRYAIQIVTDVPFFGGASGSTLEEAESWGKLAADADRVSVRADATLVVPLLVTALAGSARDLLARRVPPVFSSEGGRLRLGDAPISSERFAGAHDTAI